jgi:hypothetical protein
MIYRAFKTLCLILLLIWWQEVTFAQIEAEPDTLEDLLIYSNERSGVVVAHTLGFGAGYRSGLNRNAFSTRIISFDFVGIRSPKQLKIINPYYNNAKRYVYGKLNDVFFLRASYGFKRLLHRKPYWGGVEIRWLYEAGASVAVQKPYYLFVRRMIDNNSAVIETEKYHSGISIDDIYGRAPFTKGLNETTFVPGLFLRTGINAEFGYVKTTIRALETGIGLDFFPQGVNIMADDNDQRFFLTFYLNFGFGKRFNKY